MTKSEVEKAIKVVMFDVIEECYRFSSSSSPKNKNRVFEIAHEAENTMDELISAVREVKQKGKKSVYNPKILEIKEKLNQKSMDYLNRLHNLEYH